MPKRQQLLSIYAMLDHVAREAAGAGYGLIATLAGAAAEAARQELRAIQRQDTPVRPARPPAERRARATENSFT